MAKKERKNQVIYNARKKKCKKRDFASMLLLATFTLTLKFFFCMEETYSWIYDTYFLSPCMHLSEFIRIKLNYMEIRRKKHLSLWVRLPRELLVRVRDDIVRTLFTLFIKCAWRVTCVLCRS